jgi:cell division protein FtsI (penicillin-binding protein 3)
MEPRKTILLRVYIAFFLISLFGVAILFRIGQIQLVEGERWKQRADSLMLEYREIEAARGNIYSSDSMLLAYSVPIYSLYLDTRASSVSAELFNEKIDSIALGLSQIFNDRSPNEYRDDLSRAYAAGERFHLIRKDVGYLELQQVKQLPIFRLGRYKGGFMTEQRSKRELTYRELAKRTIGTPRDSKPVGIEAAFNADLKGVGGSRLMQKISGNTWKPVNDRDEVEPRDGDDVITTIDLNIQDVASSSLEKHLRLHNADRGCAVLMEVSTGDIKAIANLTKTEDGTYREVFNYAIAEATYPGSTFKLASMLAAIDDGYADTSDIVFVGNGSTMFYGKEVKDAHPPKSPRMTVKEVFEQSSNVGTTRLVYQYYAKDPERFIRKIYSFGLGTKLGLQIDGEARPRIKHKNEEGWSAISLPWISYGYETAITPLQILAFYNAVANNGRMVRPKFVREIRHSGQLVRSYPTEVIRDSIASPVAIAKVRKMMEGVVEHGTGSVLNKSPYKIAGKTGTAQLQAKKMEDGNVRMTYQASFAGYFPADRPRYSCIVVVYAPSNDVYYGGTVAAPVFKDIADKVYSTRLDMQMEPLKKDTAAPLPLPLAKAGNRADVQQVLKTLAVPCSFEENAAWVGASTDRSLVKLNTRPTKPGMVPNVMGMGLRDALYLLESEGLVVSVSGRGKVTRQSVDAGTAVRKGERVEIVLNQ